MTASKESVAWDAYLEAYRKLVSVRPETALAERYRAEAWEAEKKWALLYAAKYWPNPTDLPPEALKAMREAGFSDDVIFKRHPRRYGATI